MDCNEIEKMYEAGAKAWEFGAPMPKMPADSIPVLSQESLYWLGYMMARGRDFFRRRDMALYPETVEPRP